VGGLGAQLPTVQREPQGLAPGKPPDEHVLGHGKLGEVGELLVDHVDAQPQGVFGVADAHRLAVDQDPAFVQGVDPAEHAHQGALAGAVLPDDGVDLPLAQLEVNARQGDRAAEGLADALHPQQRGVGHGFS
jgi:hypothetical protein